MVTQIETRQTETRKDGPAISWLEIPFDGKTFETPLAFCQSRSGTKFDHQPDRCYRLTEISKPKNILLIPGGPGYPGISSLKHVAQAFADADRYVPGAKGANFDSWTYDPYGCGLTLDKYQDLEPEKGPQHLLDFQAWEVSRIVTHISQQASGAPVDIFAHSWGPVPFLLSLSKMYLDPSLIRRVTLSSPFIYAAGWNECVERRMRAIDKLPGKTDDPLTMNYVFRRYWQPPRLEPSSMPNRPPGDGFGLSENPNDPYHQACRGFNQPMYELILGGSKTEADGVAGLGATIDLRDQLALLKNHKVLLAGAATDEIDPDYLFNLGKYCPNMKPRKRPKNRGWTLNNGVEIFGLEGNHQWMLTDGGNFGRNMLKITSFHGSN